MKRFLLSALLAACMNHAIAAAPVSASISFFQSKYTNPNISLQKITQVVQNNFSLAQFRNIKVQVIYKDNKQIDHLLVFLFDKNHHGFKLAKVTMDARYQVLSIEKDYHLTNMDYAQQPGISAKDAQCPDDNLEFIAFAPNDNILEQLITIDVANAAIIHHLKTLQLLKKDATRTNYLNAMSCPHLKGNFYDGDADPFVIVTVDGFISAMDIKDILAKKFRFKVTNIWLACEAYNDPMKSSVIDTAQAQKYAAGINDLLIGPSDKAAACAMKSAIRGKPMTASFWDCYKKLDIPNDQWGYGGDGSDYFGV